MLLIGSLVHGGKILHELYLVQQRHYGLSQLRQPEYIPEDLLPAEYSAIIHYCCLQTLFSGMQI